MNASSHVLEIHWTGKTCFLSQRWSTMMTVRRQLFLFSISNVSNWVCYLGEFSSLSGPQFLTSKDEGNTRTTQWLLAGSYVRYCKEDENTTGLYQSLLKFPVMWCNVMWCDVMWCNVMLKNIRQLSLQWTRSVLLFFFNSVNSHTQCLNPYKFLASTLFSTKNIHRMKKLFIYYLLFGCSSVYSYTFSSRHKWIHASLHKSLTSHIGWKAVIYSVVPSTVWNFSKFLLHISRPFPILL